MDFLHLLLFYGHIIVAGEPRLVFCKHIFVWVSIVCFDSSLWHSYY